MPQSEKFDGPCDRDGHTDHEAVWTATKSETGGPDFHGPSYVVVCPTELVRP
jgi:hypothetical protein